jgi:hypothetical protein
MTPGCDDAAQAAVRYPVALGFISPVPVGLERGAHVYERGVGSHHPVIHLPDGRVAMADYRQPVVHVMRRVNNRIASMSRVQAAAESADDHATLGRWLDAHPEQACSHTHCALHGPPNGDPFTPQKYREGVLP